jgi:anti-sigma B factor antagonist
MIAMRIETRAAGKVEIVGVSGDITLGVNGATLLADKVRSLLQRDRLSILIDLSAVRHIDSAGLGELVHAWAAARNRGGSLKLVGVTRRLADLLVITKLLTVFECFESEAEAMASFERLSPIDVRRRILSPSLKISHD